MPSVAEPREFIAAWFVRACLHSTTAGHGLYWLAGSGLPTGFEAFGALVQLSNAEWEQGEAA